MRLALVFALLTAATGLAHAQGPHACARDAIAKATPLLKLHYEFGAGEKIENVAVDNNVRALQPLKALKGNGRFDVLEVWGHIYKADYRMRFIYAQIPGSCVLMGQEILEASNPY